MSDFIAALVHIVGPSLQVAGFERTAVGWVRETPQGFNAFSAFEAGDRRVVVYGWRFDALDDPPPDPCDARGCVRRMTLDEIAPTSDLRSLLAFPADEAAGQARWAERLTVAWTRSVVPWLDRWARPDGFRDYAAQGGLHVTAAWVSACLGQDERARRELELAHAAAAAGLDGDFDRARAERDAAMAAPLAARHGLSDYLAEAAAAKNQAILDAFTSRRGDAAQAKITAPDLEHRRLQHRRAVFAELCRRFVDG